MPDRRYADPIRETGLSVATIAERTGLSKTAALQRLAAAMRKGAAKLPRFKT